MKATARWADEVRHFPIHPCICRLPSSYFLRCFLCTVSTTQLVQLLMCCLCYGRLLFVPFFATYMHPLSLLYSCLMQRVHITYIC